MTREKVTVGAFNVLIMDDIHVLMTKSIIQLNEKMLQSNSVEWQCTWI